MTQMGYCYRRCIAKKICKKDTNHLILIRLYKMLCICNRSHFVFIHDTFFICIRYSTIETIEVNRIGYNRFLFPHEYSGEGRGV